MKVLDVCSGVSAPSAAWKKRGWQTVAYSEIEPFPASVLHDHFGSGRPWFMPDPSDPDLTAKDRKARRAAIKAVSSIPKALPGAPPNLGDMTRFEEWPFEICRTADLLFGGTPCQSFSVAGLRGGLEDPRGNLMLAFGYVAARFRIPRVGWENVPGVLSSNGGRDFAALLGLLTGRRVSPPAGGWGNSGVLEGIPDAYGVAWCVLDAQYFGVPQRRRRVFLVGYLGDWRRAAAVLFDGQSLRGDSPPSRKTGEGYAGRARTGASVGGGMEEEMDSGDNAPVQTVGTLSARSKAAAGLGTDFDLAGGVQVYDARGNGNGNDVNTLTGDHASRPTDYTPLVFDSTQITSKTNRSNPKPGDPAPPVTATGHAPLLAGTLQANGRAAGSATQQDAEAGMLVTHALRGEGFDGSEDGTGRGTPLVPAEYNEEAEPFVFETRIARNGRGAPGQVVPALKSRSGDTGKGDSAPIIAFDSMASGSRGLAEGDQSPTLRAMQGQRPNGGGQVAIMRRSGVRRLMPVETERLQGLPDGWTQIPWYRRSREECPDGPRYKAVGNSMATVCLDWLADRFEYVEKLFGAML